jgi:hypothetical protein
VHSARSYLTLFIYPLTAPHSKRSPLFHSAELHSIPCYTCFLPTHNPQRRKIGVRQSFRFVPQKHICKGKCTPFGRPCIYRSLSSSFALRWVLTHCRSLVLLHTLSPSSLAAFLSPQTPSKVFAKLTNLLLGGFRCLLFCSPAGRCGLIGLSCFLLSPMWPR